MALAIRPASPPDVETLAAYNAAMARETENLELDLERLTAGVAKASISSPRTKARSWDSS